MDYAVPMEKLGDLLKLYDDLLPVGKCYAFGHIGNAHIHANVIPETEEEAIAARDIVRKIGLEVCKMGGSVSGEHGIGKLKHEALEMMLGPEGINEIKTIKKLFDPKLILNIGNMVRVDHREGFTAECAEDAEKSGVFPGTAQHAKGEGRGRLASRPYIRA